MPTVPTSLKAMVSDVHTNGNDSNMLFISASGQKFPINEGFPGGVSLDSRVQQPVPDSSDSNELFSITARYIHRDRIHAAAVAFGLEDRSYVHGSGKHEGGYHPGKNKRQNQPTAAVDWQLSDLERASRLLGLPALRLVKTQEVVSRLEEQRSYSASSLAVFGGNGHRNGYRA